MSRFGLLPMLLVAGSFALGGERRLAGFCVGVGVRPLPILSLGSPFVALCLAPVAGLGLNVLGRPLLPPICSDAATLPPFLGVLPSALVSSSPWLRRYLASGTRSMQSTYPLRLRPIGKAESSSQPASLALPYPLLDGPCRPGILTGLPQRGRGALGRGWMRVRIVGNARKRKPRRCVAW